MVKVAILINDEQLRAKVSYAIQSSQDLCVVAEKCGKESDFGTLSNSQADVVVTHIDLSNQVDTGFVRGLLDKGQNRLPVVVMSSHADEEYAVKLLRMGVMGYVLTNIGYSELLTAIKTVHRGRRFVCPLIRDALASRYIDILHEDRDF